MDWLLSFFLLRVPEVTTIARRSFICFGNSLHLTFCVGCVCVCERAHTYFDETIFSR